MWGVNHALGLIQAFLPSRPPLCRCGCVEQTERFVSFDDNAANGRRENRVVGKFIVLLRLVLFERHTHANSACIKRVFNDVVRTAERPHWQEVWKSKAKLGCEEEDCFLVNNVILLVSYSLISSDLTCMTDSERDQIDQDAQIFMRTCSEAIRQLRNEGALFFYCAADFLL